MYNRLITTLPPVFFISLQDGRFPVGILIKQNHIVPGYETPEGESKDKHGVWDFMPELTKASPYVDSNTFTTGNPMPDSTLTLIRMVKVENDLVALEA
jgi:hypothetical protein